jgi:hypothetical protein
MAKKKIIGTNPLIPTGAGTRPEVEGKQESKQESKQNITASKQDESKEKRETKSASYYIGFDAQLSVDELQIKVRRAIGRKISKSELVEAAIMAAALDFESTGKGSPFYNQLLKIV